MSHWDDITIAGPFYPLTSVLMQMRGYLHDKSQAGMCIVDELDKAEGLLAQVEHIKAPLDADRTKFALVEIIREQNPKMARLLPGPAYNVVSTMINLDRDRTELQARDPSPYPRVDEKEVHGCFPTLGEANAKATEIAHDVMKDLQGARMIPFDDAWAEQGQHSTYAMKGRAWDGEQKLVVVEVSFDDGQIRPI